MPMPPHLIKAQAALVAKRLAMAGMAKSAVPAISVSKPNSLHQPVMKDTPAAMAVPTIDIGKVALKPKFMKVSKVERRQVDRLGLVATITASLSKSLGLEIVPASKATNIPGIIKTRSATLNHAVGRGGIPFGRLIVLTGSEGGGKTTLALELVAEVQKMGGVGLYIDAEHKLDLDYAASLGVNLDELLVAYPENAEEGFKTLSGTIDLVRASYAEQKSKDGKITQSCGVEVPVILILDSVNALLSKLAAEADYGEGGGAGLGSHARAFSEALPKFLKKVRGQMVAPIFISQQRAKISSYGGGKEKVSGGNAVKFYAAMVLDIVRTGNYRRNGAESGPYIGSEVEVTVIKNQVAKPYQVAALRNHWGTGTDVVHSLLLHAVTLGILNRGSGGWYEIPWDGDTNGIKLVDGCLKWQGQTGYHRTIAKIPALATYIQTKVDEEFIKLASEPIPDATIPDIPSSKEEINDEATKMG